MWFSPFQSLVMIPFFKNSSWLLTWPLEPWRYKVSVRHGANVDSLQETSTGPWPQRKGNGISLKETSNQESFILSWLKYSGKVIGLCQHHHEHEVILTCSLFFFLKCALGECYDNIWHLPKNGAFFLLTSLPRRAFVGTHRSEP